MTDRSFFHLGPFFTLLPSTPNNPGNQNLEKKNTWGELTKTYFGVPKMKII